MLPVRTGTLVMLLVALLFGGLAVFIAKFWLSTQQIAVEPTAPQPEPVQTQTIVVANKDLRFGEPLTPEVLSEIPWPKNAVLEGSFQKIADVDKDGRRVVLSPIGVNEPVLSWKISGPGARATLSSLVKEGMRAVTIRINDTSGVAGFVLPGDRVDVLYTYGDEKGSTIDVLFQGVRVLAVNQNADEKNASPIDGHVATLELSPVDAQKLALAQSTGALTFTLRPAGSLDTAPTDAINQAELLANTSLYQAAENQNAETKAALDAQAKTQSEMERRIQELEGKVKEATVQRAQQVVTEAKSETPAPSAAIAEKSLPTTADIVIYRGLAGSRYTVPLDANP